MGDWGMRVSKEGFDVKTCADYDLVMSSSFNMLKTVMTGTASGTTFIDHGLDYPPIYFCTNLINGSTSSMVGQNSTSTDNWTNSDINNFNVYSGTVKYYLFYQEGA